MNYSLDIPKLAEMLLPSFLRTEKLYAYLCALLAPFVQIHFAFVEFIDATNLSVAYTGQTLLIEDLLNYRFPNNTNQPIFITNLFNDSPAVYWGYDTEPDHDVSLPNLYNQTPDVYIGYENEQTNSDYDFIINIPSTTPFTLSTIIAIVNQYGIIARKRFNIVYY